MLITVTDTGPGIPVASPSGSSTGSTAWTSLAPAATGGSGLGLAICREVLAVLEGSIRIAASSAEGTTFEIRVPGRVVSERRVSGELGGTPSSLQPDEREVAAPAHCR